MIKIIVEIEEAGDRSIKALNVRMKTEKEQPTPLEASAEKRIATALKSAFKSD
jgi:hypothetical protein